MAHVGALDTIAALEPAVYLARRYIKARGVELGEAGDPSDLIAEQISQVAAGLLVMGADSHSRLREFVLSASPATCSPIRP